ncbi:MAG: transglutaminase family protein [Nocardioides sp.]
MRRISTGFAGHLAQGVAAALTTWMALWSWHGFTHGPGRFLGPLLLLALVVAVTGALLRWGRTPGSLVVAVQAVVGGAIAAAMITHRPLPVGAGFARLVDALTAAVHSSQQYASPVPESAPDVYPLLIGGGLLCLLLVDALACTAGRAPLAGLPLLMVYSIPISLLGNGVSWWIFAATAAGFLVVLHLQQTRAVAQWGRTLDQDPDVLRGRPPTVRTGAGGIGGVATALAVVVPLLVPTFGLHLFDFGKGPGGNDEITIQNPMADLVRDLHRSADQPLLRVTTDDPDPSYLRIAVLNRFTDNEWSSGDRSLPDSNTADGDLPPLQGVSPDTPRTSYRYDVSVDPAFRSTWLPTQYPVSRVEAAGDWRYDPATMDFLAFDKQLTTAGLDYSMTAVKLGTDAQTLATAPAPSGLISASFVELPPGIPASVRRLAEEVTADAPTRFGKAVALQDWFRVAGGFTYDLHTAPGDGSDELVSFLSRGQGGRTGYCEQFAAAMAVMARELRIPARVAIGFLVPDRVGPQTYEYSSDDLHAWPELYFPGSGWVRFEPTPAERASRVPAYTTQQLPGVDPSSAPSASASSSAAVVPSKAPKPTASVASSRSGSSGSGFPWAALLVGVAAVALVVLLGLLPRVLRRRARHRRLAGGPEECWAEVRATVVDLGLGWPEGRSPRETRGVLVGHLGVPLHDQTPERPASGEHVAPEATLALDRLVGALERHRYARDPGAGGSLRADTETCLAALEGGATRAARRRAEWWPRSLGAGAGRRGQASGERPVQARFGGVVDRVG